MLSIKIRMILLEVRSQKDFRPDCTTRVIGDRKSDLVLAIGDKLRVDAGASTGFK